MGGTPARLSRGCQFDDARFVQRAGSGLAVAHLGVPLQIGLGLVSAMAAEAWATTKEQGQVGAGMKNLARDHADHAGWLLRGKFARSFDQLLHGGSGRNIRSGAGSHGWPGGDDHRHRSGWRGGHRRLGMLAFQHSHGHSGRNQDRNASDHCHDWNGSPSRRSPGHR